MNRIKLIDYVSSESNITKADAVIVVDAFIEGLKHFLIKNKRVSINGFGSLNVVKQKSRISRNPRTGESIVVPDKKIVKFKISPELKEKINKKK